MYLLYKLNACLEYDTSQHSNIYKIYTQRIKARKKSN